MGLVRRLSAHIKVSLEPKASYSVSKLVIDRYHHKITTRTMELDQAVDSTAEVEIEQIPSRFAVCFYFTFFPLPSLYRVKAANTI
jgi:hypothetical protein